MQRLLVDKIDTFSGHRDCVYTLQQGFDKTRFFSAGGDGFVIEWDLSKPDWGKVVAQVPASIYAMAYDMPKNQLWIGQNYEGIQVIDVENKEVMFSSNFTKAAIFDIQHFDKQTFVALSDGVVVVFDKENLAIKKYLKASDKSARCMAINPYTNEIAVGYSDHQIRVFDTISLELKYTIEAHQNSVFCVQYSPDGMYLLSGSRDAHLKIWNVKQPYQLYQDVVAHLFAINHIAYSPTQSIFATCSMDKSIKIWNATTFKLIKVIDRARHAGHATSVNKLWWSNYDNILVSCSDDKKISVWSVKIF